MSEIRLTSRSLFHVIGTSLEAPAREQLGALVMEHITNERIAVALGCDARTVRRLLPLYGWPNRAWSPPKRKPVKDRFKNRSR